MAELKQNQEAQSLQFILDEKFDLLFEKLDKITFWLKFSNMETAKEYFEKVLNTERKKEVYQLTDGRSIGEIMRVLKITSKSVIPELWADWTAKGILMESNKIKGRKIKVIDLKEFGL